MKTCLFVLLLALSSATCIGQKDTLNNSEFNKNSIYGSVGSGGFYFTATAYYERLIFNPFEQNSISPLFKIGYGGYADWNGQSDYIIAQAGIITGINKHHFESSAGIVFYPKDEIIFPSILVGYRKQKPNSPFMFRTGLGFPEALYAGIGWTF
jgi:hypothetical protein